MSLKEPAPTRKHLLRPHLPFEEPLTGEPFASQIEQAHEVAEQATTPLPAVAIAAELQKTSPQSKLSSTRPATKNKQKARKKRLPIWFAVCSIITIIAVVFVAQGNGTVGAQMADTLRAIVGPTITAEVESWYLSLSNTTTQVQYQLNNKKVAAPWKVASVTPVATQSAHSTTTTMTPMTLTPMSPMITPALPGEGTWTVLDNAPAPYSYLPLDAKAFIRPDPAHPYAVVTMLQFDPRFTLLHIVSGTTEPGGPRGMRGPGVIPASDVKGNTLLAAFNGGFKYADGQYGLMANGIVYVPPQPGAATIAVNKKGQLILGAWGVDPLLNSQNKNLVAWRQNASLLIDKGVINPLTHDGAAWGGTILNSAYTWRSAIGITTSGNFIYAAGNALTAETLGEAMKAAGAAMAMQTDINPFWVRAFLYNRDHSGRLSITKLNPQMQGTGYEYLYGTQRDFFYLTRTIPKK
jgi:hypothetical protein